MNFLTSSTDDLEGIVNSYNFQIIEPCKFKQWPWHSDEHGCFLLFDKTTNEFYHIYRHQIQHFDNKGHSVAEVVGKEYDCDFDFTFRYYFVPPPKPSTCRTPSLVEKKQGLVAVSEKYQTENTPITNQYTKFSVHLGMDINTINSAFDVDVHGSRVMNNLHCLMSTYCSKILPLLNEGEQINWVSLEQRKQINHLLPEQLFDVICNGSTNQLTLLRPCSIVNDWRLFLDGLRNQVMGIIKLAADSYHPDINEIFMNPEKFRERKICSASTFASSRHIVHEFRCSAKNSDHCPHIMAATNLNGQLELNVNADLCHFLLSRYLETFDESQVNATFDFKCQYNMTIPKISKKNATQHYSYDHHQQQQQHHHRSIDHTQNNVQIFQSFMGRHVMLHRMCVPTKYLSVNWFRFILKLLDLEKSLN